MFEGTPQEMKEIKRLGFFEFKPNTEIVDNQKDHTDDKQNVELTKEAVINALIRHGGLTYNQKLVVKAIYEHGQEGISSTEISKVSGLPKDTIKGTMRTIGKRIAHTKNWPDGIRAFDQYWNGAENIYKLHGIMRTIFDSGAIKI